MVSACLLAVAVAAAGLTVAAGLAVVGWFVGGAEDVSGQVVRTGALIWLGAHGGSLSVASATLSLVPLLAPLLIGLALLRGCRWAVRSSAAGPVLLPPGLAAGGAAAAGAACYGAVVALVGWGVHLSAVPGAADGNVLRGVGISVVGVALTLVIGLGVADGSWTAVAARRPSVGACVRGARAGVLGMLALSALVVVGALVLHANRVLEIGADLEPGTSGGLGLAVLCVATLPNALLWAAAYLVGPGFAVGSATVVAPDGVMLGALPAYPLLGALPEPGPPPGWVPVLTVAPVLAGMLAGIVAARGLSGVGWWRQAVVGAVAGLGAGLVLAVLMVVAGGSVGPGRMQQTGPLPASLAVAVATLTVTAAAGAVADGALAGWRPGWLHRPGWLRPAGRLPGWLHRSR